jgi:hypothetical protein
MEEATSRFLAPVRRTLLLRRNSDHCSQIFNRLVAQFDFAFRNVSEPILDGRVTTRGKIEYYFKAFGSVVEVELNFGSRKERMDAIAQAMVRHPFNNNLHWF